MPRGLPPETHYQAKQGKLMSTSQPWSKDRRRAVDMMNAGFAEDSRVRAAREEQVSSRPPVPRPTVGDKVHATIEAGKGLADLMGTLPGPAPGLRYAPKNRRRIVE